MKLSMIHLILTCSTFFSVTSSSLAIAGDPLPPSGSGYITVTNPDQFAFESIFNELKGASDTGRAKINICHRRISRPDFIQVVCTGMVQDLVFGGHPVNKTISCLHNFKLIRDTGQYLTSRQPKCNG